VTGNRRPEAEQLVASSKGAQKATSHVEQGGDSCHPARRLELSAGTGSSDANNTATNLEEAVQFAQCMRDDSVKDFPDPTTDGPLIDASRIPAATGRGARRIAGIQAAADMCTAIYLSALGVRGQ
jgi:hypothetical protein